LRVGHRSKPAPDSPFEQQSRTENNPDERQPSLLERRDKRQRCCIMDRLIEAAREFAVEKHGNQKRKYDGAPYIVHLEGVAGILIENGHTEPGLIAAALLHDTVEDTDATIQKITELFGENVAELVYWLTDAEEGNRKSRVLQSAWRLSRAPWEAKLIKLADIIDNGSAIMEHDPGFGPIFLREKREVLEKMAAVEGYRLTASPLFQKANAIVAEARPDTSQ
jgi:(p)ppGpp synthase/HD superfamily hydrolase